MKISLKLNHPGIELGNIDVYVLHKSGTAFGLEALSSNSGSSTWGALGIIVNQDVDPEQEEWEFLAYSTQENSPRVAIAKGSEVINEIEVNNPIISEAIEAHTAARECQTTNTAVVEEECDKEEYASQNEEDHAS